MSNLAKYVPLKTCVAYFLDANNKSIGDFDRCWVMAFRAMVLMGIQISWQPKTVRLPVSGNKTVALPSDYVGIWSKIGVLNNKGEVCTCKVNNALTTWKDENPNRISQLATSDVTDAAPALINAPFFFNYYTNDGYCQPMYGIGGGLIQYGECRVDEKNNVIVLNPEFQYSQILFEYLSSPQQDDDYQVEIQLQEPIVAFLEWKSKIASREEFYGAVTEARRSLPGKRVILQQVNDVIRQTGGQYMKA